VAGLPELSRSRPARRARVREITLAHGSGGEAMWEFIHEEILPRLGGPLLRKTPDAAVFELGGVRLAFTTDSYTVKPLTFPGGDIGKLAVFGTANDLAVVGARPLYLSCSLILEEGFPLEELRRYLESMREAAGVVGVEVATGDTKVVERGSADGLFVNTSGIGLVRPDARLDVSRVEPGDVVIVSGTIGDHGMAVYLARGEWGLEAEVWSDCGPVLPVVEAALEAGGEAVKFCRDPTRGGLSAVLNEVARSAGLGIEVEEAKIPVSPAVREACEVLGMEPWSLACEGRVVIICSPWAADRILSAVRASDKGKGAEAIGRVVPDHPGEVLMRTEVGGLRLLEMPLEEQVPRIC